MTSSNKLGEENEPETASEIVWSDVTGMNLNKIPFLVEHPGIRTHISSFFTNHLTNFINYSSPMKYLICVFGKQTCMQVSETAPRFRIQSWKETDFTEMKKFVGCIMWMDLVQLP